MSSITVDMFFYSIYRYAGLILSEQTGISADQTEEARVTYNTLVDAWRADGLTISHIYRYLAQLVGGQGDYSIGPGGDIDVPWQDRIERAGIVLSNESPAPEYPIWPMTVDEYQMWTLKEQTTNWPRAFWYERKGPPLGIIHLLYVPTDANQLALYLEEFLLDINATGDSLLEWAPGYQLALETNCAVHIAARTPGSNISADTRKLAVDSLALIRNANNRPLMRLSDMTSGRGGRSDVRAGNRFAGGSWS